MPPAPQARAFSVARRTVSGVKILVTGGSGFIGTHLLRHLVLETANEVVAVTRAPLRLSHPRLTEVRSELGNSTTVREAMTGCDAVVHLAAMSSVRDAQNDPAACMYANVTLSALLALAAAQAGVARFVLASSSVLYGQPEQLPITELTPPAPRDVYGLSKLAAEAAVSTLHSSALSLRIFNVFGPGQTGTLVPALINKLRTSEQVTLEGNGSQVRSFLYVSDIVSALVSAIYSDITGVLNIAGFPESVLGIHDTVARCMGVASTPVFGPARPNDAAEISADVSAAHSLLGWKPLISIEEGLRLTLSTQV